MEDCAENQYTPRKKAAVWLTQLNRCIPRCIFFYSTSAETVIHSVCVCVLALIRFIAKDLTWLTSNMWLFRSFRSICL